MVKFSAEPSTITFSDVDFITKSKAFRELPGKTQMTLLPDGIAATDRLGHTLSVHRGVCTVARALGLNETRAAAIALGHDVGHGPFGHAFEEALEGKISGDFHHAIHSVRRLRELERLPVSIVVFQGIAGHTKGAGNFLDVTWSSSQEGSIVKIVDAISYCCDDFEKSLARGWVTVEDVPGAALRFLGRDPHFWEVSLLQDLVDSTHAARGEVRMSPPGGHALVALRNYLRTTVYFPLSKSKPQVAAVNCIASLFKHYAAEPEDIPGPATSDDPAYRAIDFLATLSDAAAVALADSRWPGSADAVAEPLIGPLAPRLDDLMGSIR